MTMMPPVGLLGPTNLISTYANRKKNPSVFSQKEQADLYSPFQKGNTPSQPQRAKEALFSGSRQHRNFRNTWTKTIKEMEAMDAEADWKAGKKNPFVTDDEASKLLYRRERTKQKAQSSSGVKSFIGGMIVAEESAEISDHIQDPTHQAEATVAGTQLRNVPASKITDLIEGAIHHTQQAYRGKSPERPELVEKVNKKMKKRRPKEKEGITTTEQEGLKETARILAGRPKVLSKAELKRQEEKWEQERIEKEARCREREERRNAGPDFSHMKVDVSSYGYGTDPLSPNIP
jgi:hypothetical protein